MLRNSKNSYGWAARSLHWLLAVLLTGLFALGWWMLTLDYYDPWYHQGPFWHESFGIVAFLLILGRILWRRADPPPPLESTLAIWEKFVAHWTHMALYALMFIIPFSGYFIGTAKGEAIDVFGWFKIPAIITKVEHMEDIAGAIHAYLAYALAGLVVMHALAALKHHFIDRNSTLIRMVGFWLKNGSKN